MMEWQPIETAPKDGTDFLAGWAAIEPDPFCDGKACIEIVRYNDRGVVCGGLNRDCGMSFPTHWMPLPKPPAQEKKL